MQELYIIVKITGVLFVLAGGIGGGWHFAARKKQRIDVLQELEQALLLLYGDIDYAAGDMVETLEGLAGKTKYFSSFFHGVSCRLDRKCGQPLWKMWQEEMERSSAKNLLAPGDCELWKELGLHLGALDRQTQLHTLKLLQERLQQRIREADQEYRSQARVCRVLGVTVGVFAIILLL